MKLFGFGKDDAIVPNLSRRRFLFLAPAVVAASSLMPGHSVAHLLAPDHYKVMADKIEEIARVNNSAEPSTSLLSTLTNDLFNYGMKHFPPGYVPGTLTADERTVLQNEVRETFRSNPRPVQNPSIGPNITIEEMLRRIPERQVPILSAKIVIGHMKAHVEAPKMPSWKLFVKTYADTLPNV